MTRVTTVADRKSDNHKVQISLWHSVISSAQKDENYQRVNP